VKVKFKEENNRTVLEYEYIVTRDTADTEYVMEYCSNVTFN
jgi:hypothetical protein